MFVGLAHQQLGLPAALVQRGRLLPLLRSVVLHHVAPLLPQQPALLHLLGARVLGAEQLVLAQVAAVLLHVDGVALLVPALRRLLLPLRRAAHRLARPRPAQRLGGRVRGEAGQLARPHQSLRLALPQLALLNHPVDERAVLLETELGVVADLDPDLGLALEHLLPAEELPEVGMPGDVEHARPPLRVEAERLAEQVVALGRAVAGPLLAAQRLDLGQQLQHLLPEVGLQRLQVLDGRRAGPGQHPLDLVQRRVPRKHGLAGQQLAQQAAEAPHVRRLRVLLGAEQDLGRAVPAGGDVIGEQRLLGLVLLD